MAETMIMAGMTGAGMTGTGTKNGAEHRTGMEKIDGFFAGLAPHAIGDRHGPRTPAKVFERGQTMPATVLIALTRHGATHAARLASHLPQATLLVAERFAPPPGQLTNPIRPYRGPLRPHIGPLFEQARSLIFFLSVGAVVRLIAPHLRGKEKDPAVLCIDDAARFTIPLLSGHLGGANALAEEVAALLGNLPVITTASDVGGTIPVDILGRELAWQVEADKETLTRSAAHVVNGEPVAFVQETGSRQWWPDATPLPTNIHCFPTLEALQPEAFRAILWVTHRQTPKDWQPRLAGKLVIYRPPIGQQP